MTSTGTDGVPMNSPRERGKEKQPIPPRQVAQPGAQSFTWKATDENDDTLEYSIYLKGEGETEWKQLEKKTTETFHTLEAGSLPDGAYTVRASGTLDGAPLSGATEVAAGGTADIELKGK